MMFRLAILAGAMMSASYPSFAVIDIKQNPGCGVKEVTAQARITRNSRIAELLYQSYLEGPKYHYLYNWEHYDCIAKDATGFNWLMAPLTTARPRLIGNRDRDLMQKEMKAHWKVMPDYGAMPGTFAVYAWDGGATFRLVYGGHTADGKLHSTWEVDTILINDEGKITHWEFWNDSLGSDDIVYTVFGKHLLGLPEDQYLDTIKQSAK
jgi:hypothetical protein